MSSTPSLTEFNPNVIPQQIEVIRDIRKNFSYKDGMHEILLSGSIGSAKSIVLAHLAVTHCLLYKESVVCLARKAMPDLKDTIFQTILEHLDCEALVEGEDYIVNLSRTSIFFTANKSRIISRSWADKKFKKFRSITFSMLIIEELTENDNTYKEFYTEAIGRLNRLPHVPEQICIAATNPDSPAHWAYDYFIKKQGTNRHVYYSITTDNPFLPDSYIKQLKEIYDPKMARRMLYGEWLAITQDIIYHQYDSDVHFKKSESWEVINRLPIHICWDFNIGIGKPLSLCMFQYVGGKFHFFNECVVEGQRTEDSLEEIQHRGLLDYNCPYIVHGDATGRSNNTRSIRTDYDIIDKFLINYSSPKYGRLRVTIQVPRANPPLRKRHNTVNAQMRNANNKVNLYVYKECPNLDKGFSLTCLKKGGQYIEQEDYWQHETTAAGYGIVTVKAQEVLSTATSGGY